MAPHPPTPCPHQPPSSSRDRRLAHSHSSPHAPKHSSKQQVDPSPRRRLRAIACSALSAHTECRQLILAKIDATPPTPPIEADDRGDEPIGSSPSQSLALRRSAPPSARSCRSSRRRAHLSSCAVATAYECRPSHAGLRSYCQAAEPPAGDGSRRSATATSRDDHRWPRAATHEPSAAHASHPMLGAARAPRQPAASEHSTLREQRRRAHAASHEKDDALRPPTTIGRSRCWLALPRVQPCKPAPARSCRHLPRCA